MRASRFIPLGVIVVFAGILFAIYGPGWIRELAIRAAANEFISRVKAGKLVSACDLITSSERDNALALARRFEPQDFQSYIHRLGIDYLEDAGGPDSSIVHLHMVIRVEGSKVPPYDVRTVWHRTDGKWFLSLKESAYAYYNPIGEMDYISVERELRSLGDETGE